MGLAGPGPPFCPGIFLLLSTCVGCYFGFVTLNIVAECMQLICVFENRSFQEWSFA